MSKPFKTYRQQLNILRSRNLIIDNGSKAIDILKKEGYYNIINGYKEIFLDEPLSKQMGMDYYKNGTTFNHIYALYDFDREIRAIILKYILKMESSLKTKVSYYFSERYKQNFNYLDINNFDNQNPQKITKLIARLSSVITQNSEQKDQGGQFYHYLDKHKELPLWVLTTKMTLGEIFHFFGALEISIKDKIVNEFIDTFKKEYSIKNNIILSNKYECFLAIFYFINEFRNICAHEERLYNVIIKRKGKLPRIIMFHNQKSNKFTSKVFDCILILGLFISKKDYNKLLSAIKSEIISLNRKLPQNIFNAVLIKMGFSKTWETDLKLP